ncbi:MAG: alpha/beta hydrolase, partial [bacterium]
MAWTEGDISIDGVRIHYYRRGTGRPLVLAHGFSDNGKCWDRVATVLEDRYDVIAFDARHHGLSDKPADGSIGDGNDLVALVEALGLEKAALLGHSMGAGTVAQAAGERPELFRCAILEDPAWRDGPMPPPAGGREMPRWSELSVEKIIELGKAQSPSWHAAEFPAWAESKQQFRIPEAWATRRPA